MTGQAEPLVIATPATGTTIEAAERIAVAFARIWFSLSPWLASAIVES
jgi:hypothetical protein